MKLKPRFLLGPRDQDNYWISREVGIGTCTPAAAGFEDIALSIDDAQVQVLYSLKL